MGGREEDINFEKKVDRIKRSQQRRKRVEYKNDAFYLIEELSSNEEREIKLFPAFSSNENILRDLADMYTKRFNEQDREARKLAVDKAFFVCDFALTLKDVIQNGGWKFNSQTLKELVEDHAEDVITSAAEWGLFKPLKCREMIVQDEKKKIYNVAFIIHNSLYPDCLY